MTERSNFLEKKIDRRKALGSAAKVGIAAGVGVVVGAIAGYLGGAAAAPAKTVTKTVTSTYTTTVGGAAAPTTVTVTATAAAAVSSTQRVIEEARKKYKGVKVTVCCESGHDEKQMTAFAEKWKELTGMEVEVLPAPVFAVREKVISEGTAKTGAIDAVNAFPIWFADLVEGGFLEPINDFIEKYQPDMSDFVYLKYFTTLGEDGKIYGFPIDLDDFILYYRRDIFENEEERAAFKEKYGRPLEPPKTWKEFEEIAAFFKRARGEKLAGQTIDFDFGGHVEFRAREGVYNWFWNRAASYGVRYFKKTETDLIPGIDTPEAVQALEDMIAVNAYGIPAAESVSWEETIGAFMGGHALMNIFWPMMGKMAQYTVDSKVKNKVGYAVMPGVKQGSIIYRRSQMAAGKTLCLTSDSRNKEAVYLFMHWLCSPETQFEMAMYNKPDSLGAMDPIRWRILYSKEIVEHFVKDGWKYAAEFYEAHRSNAMIGHPEIKLLGAMEYWDKLDYELVEAITGSKSVEQALSDAAAAWEDITKDYGKDKQMKLYDPELYELGGLY